jgi:hypothetical protein
MTVYLDDTVRIQGQVTDIIMFLPLGEVDLVAAQHLDLPRTYFRHIKMLAIRLQLSQ